MIKSIRIVPKVSENANIENQKIENVSETQQQAIEQQPIVNSEQPESSQNNQLLNEEPENVDRQVSGTAQQTENTPQEEQGQGIEKGLEENVKTIPIQRLLRPNGAVGTQGVTTEQVSGILENVLGLSIPENATMRSKC